MKIAVFYFSHDGITSIYTGVGTSGRDFCLSFIDIIKEYKEKGIIIDFFPGTIKYTKEFHGFSHDVRNLTLNSLNELGGRLIEVDNGSGGKLSYGNINYWTKASKNAALEIDKIADNYDKVIAFSSDTSFAGVSFYTTAKNIINIWIPRSTAKIHTNFKLREEDGTMEKFLRERIDWEEQAINMANIKSNCYIGYIGDYVKKHLIKDYNANPDKLVKLTIGIYYPRLETYRRSQESIKVYLKSKNIPTDKSLLVSFARTEYYKGLDIVIELGGYLNSRYGTQTVILTVPYSMEDPYIQELEKIKINTNPSAIIIYGHDFITPHYLMQWNKTRIVAALSRQEPTGLVPSEFRYYKNQDAQLLISDKDGLPERVTSGIDGFICNIEDMADIKKKADNIMNLDDRKRIKISNSGYERVIKDYYLPTNIKNALDFIFFHCIDTTLN